MKSQCEGSGTSVQAAGGAKALCPWCGKLTLVTKDSTLRTHSINGGWMGGVAYNESRQPKPAEPKVLPPRPDVHFRTPLRRTIKAASRYFKGTHVIATNQSRSTRLEWKCLTCGEAGATTRAFVGQDLVAKARMNHYQRARRASQ